VRTRRENHLPDRKTGKKKKGKKREKNSRCEINGFFVSRRLAVAIGFVSRWRQSQRAANHDNRRRRQHARAKRKGKKKEMKKEKRKKKGKMHKLREGKRTAHVVEIALDLLDLRVELVDFFLHRFRFTHGFAFFSLVQKNPVNRVDLDHTT
jgi:hypothetical protein